MSELKKRVALVTGASRGIGRAIALALASAGVAARSPIGRAGTPDEIAHGVVGLIGNAFLTGQTIAINGGALFC